MTSKKTEAYEWALFGGMMWSADAREGIQATDFQTPHIQALVRELLDVYAGKVAVDQAYKIREWLRESRVHVENENRNSFALKTVVQYLAALSRSRRLVTQLSDGLAKNAAGLPGLQQSELRKLAEQLLSNIDPGDAPRPLD